MGLKSGVIYRWVSLMEARGGAAHHPLSVLENPAGLLARNEGADLSALVGRLNAMGYAVSILNVDAKHFVPQSRPRIFICCFDKKYASQFKRLTSLSDLPACKDLYPAPLRKWLGKNLHLNLVYVPTPSLPVRTVQLEDVIDLDMSSGDGWADPAFKDELTGNLKGVQSERFKKLVASPCMTVSTVARRGRKDESGNGFNATEISVSGLAPAQRPYSGGSSRCWVLVAGQGRYNFKVVTPRESARLMGFPDSFVLPDNARNAYQCTGDAVCPQAVSWVEQHVFKPVVLQSGKQSASLVVNEQFAFEF